ncbi:CaiB/BaiF CoA transferase family protein [Sphingobium nicotianae]|uniref:CoA transferase n=1 Tax=Sphingobium nicotianae TaxID=2782607 RepID=A0A9X1DD68_9SPHN|nr:CoA transferase [Sphingobium nicotianae]MBT2187853.1 CoA transferase [Sphingobium nicotianae]
MAQPLKDVTVLEMGTFITGPAAGMLLADLGARVIKIEQTGQGDPFRAFKGGLYSPHFQTYNRGKQSIELDTRKPEDLAVLDKLVADADVFIQNFRPGVAARLGVDAPRLQGLNPRLIYASISGFGPEGPDRDRPAFDTVAQAASGFLRLLVNPAHPRVVGPAIADALTGFYAAYGILAALNERHVTGKGRLVETSMFESMAHFNLDDFTHYFSEGLIMGPSSRPHVSQSYVFQCADGKWLALHMSSPPKFWENLAEAVGRPDMLGLPQFATRDARIDHYEDVVAFLAPIFATRDRDDWCGHLQALEVPHSPVRSSAEVAASPQAAALGLVIEDPDGPHGRFRTIRSPVSFDGERMTQVTAPPVLGADNDTIVAPLRGGN